MLQKMQKLAFLACLLVCFTNTTKIRNNEADIDGDSRHPLLLNSSGIIGIPVSSLADVQDFVAKQDLPGVEEFALRHRLLHQLPESWFTHPMAQDGPAFSPLLRFTELAPSEDMKTIAVVSLFDPITKYIGKTIPHCPRDCRLVGKDASPQADAVVWNAIMKGQNDYGSKPRHQKWIFNFFFESPYYLEARRNQWAVDGFANQIDWTLTYASDSDFVQNLGMMVNKEQTDDEHVHASNPAANRSKLLLWFVSNCASTGRLKIFNKIKALLPKGKVDIFGNCGDHDPCGENKDCLRNLMSQYKFYAAFENSRCPGYITEKFWRAYEYGMVPLALGGIGRQDYERIAPADSFLHVEDFSSIQSMANRLLEIDKDDAGYAKYFNWKKSFRVAMPYSEEAAVKPYCALCEELHKPRAEQKPSRSGGFFVRGNLTRWFYDECKTATPTFTDNV